MEEDRKIGCIIQARMGSTRLPGKVLQEIAGKPMLQYLLERIERCTSVDLVVVATSVEKSDDGIADFCRQRGILFWRGEELNVASRFKEVLEHWGIDAFVRICGDSPFLDHELVDKLIGIFCLTGCDLVTNVFPRTFPNGQSVEILSTEVFANGYSRMQEREDLEHVTTFFYKNARDFHIVNVPSETDYSQIHLSVDTPHDMELCQCMIAHMAKPHWDYRLHEVVGLFLQIKASLNVKTTEAKSKVDG